MSKAKTVTIAIIFGLYLCGIPAGMAQEMKLDREFLGLKGPVKSAVSKVAYVSVKSRQYVEQCCSTLYNFTFDVAGNSISGGFQEQPIDFGTGEPPPTKKPIYDADRKQIGEETYNHKGSLERKTIYSYDTKGNRTTESDYSSKGNLVSRREYTSDAKHLLLEEIIYLFNGTPSTRWTYDKYDFYDNCVKRTAWDWKTRDGKSYWEPSSVYYEDLTYYRNVSINVAPKKRIRWSAASGFHIIPLVHCAAPTGAGR